MNSTLTQVTLLVFAFVATPFVTLRASDADGLIKDTFNTSYVRTTILREDDIMVDCSNGVVLLTGHVTDEFHKAMAQEMMANLAGVMTVENRIQITNDTPATIPCVATAASVRGMLAIHRDMEFRSLEVKIQAGTAVLQGQACSRRQRNLITQYVMCVGGVDTVQNDMTVGEGADAQPGIQKECVDDASITAQVKMVLKCRRSSIPQALHFTTRCGVVHFSGNRMTASEKDQIGMLVSGINGVKYMINSDDGLVAYCTDPSRMKTSTVAQTAMTSAKGNGRRPVGVIPDPTAVHAVRP